MPSVCSSRLHGPHRMHRRLRSGAQDQRQSSSIVAGKNCSECEGQRPVLLSDGRFVRGSSRGRVVYAAFTFSNLLHCSLRVRAFRSGILARARRQETPRGSRVRFHPASRLIHECKIKILLRKFCSDDLSGRIGSPPFSYRERPASPLINGGGPVRPSSLLLVFGS